MTIAEVERYADAWAYRQNEELKLKANMDYIHATTIAIMIAHTQSKNGKMPELYECYPELFKEEAEASRLNKQKAYLLNFANAFNEHIKENNNG